MKVLGYARTSTFLQEASIKAQKEKITKYCDLKEWKLKKIYSDEGKSGSNLDRPSWKKLVEELETGQYQGIVFTKLDRVARSLSDLLQIVDFLEKKKVNLCSIDDNISTEGIQGRLMLQIMGAFAEFERATIRQRLEEGLVRAKERGVVFGRKPSKISDEKLLEWKKLGLSPRKIAKQFGVSHVTIYKRLKELEK